MGCRTKTFRTVLTCGAAIATLAAADVACAAEAADAATGSGAVAKNGDIIVAASKRAEKLADVGIAVTAVSGDDLAYRHQTRIGDRCLAIDRLAEEKEPAADRHLRAGFSHSAIGAFLPFGFPSPTDRAIS